MSLTPERWHLIESLFHEALERPLGERAEYVRRCTAGDPALGDIVGRLVAEDERTGTFLDEPAAAIAETLFAAAKRELPNERFGPYRVVEWLGEGGMGVVYRAERDDVGATVALKILGAGGLSPARHELFARERRVLASLRHARIAQLFDAGAQPDGTLWFAMEYVPGEPLADYCRRNALPLEARLHVFRDVCDAVHFAHRHMVVHGDLKPSNVLVTEDGQVKLLDFGVATTRDALTGGVASPGQALRALTPAYAAPEQHRGEEAGVHSDVYSLGVILFELLTDRLPPAHVAARTPADEHAADPGARPPPSDVVTRFGSSMPGGQADRRAAWGDLDAICAMAMHEEAAKRYASVDALARDVERLLRCEPVEARSGGRAYRLGKYLRRHRVPVASATAGVVLLIAMATTYTAYLARARQTADIEARRADRIRGLMVDVFEGGDDAVSPPDSLRVVTLLDGAVRNAASLSREPVVQAELYHTLGGLLQKLGKLDRADSLIRLGLDRRRALMGARHPDVGTSLVDLGMLRAEQARYDEAESSIRAGQRILTAALGPLHPRVASAHASLGKVFELHGQYDKAIGALEQAVAIFAQAGDTTRDFASTLSALANSHYYLGHLDSAEVLNRRVLAMTRKLYGERHALVADDLINLGAIQSDRGNYAQAESLYRAGVEIMEGWYGPDHHRTAGALGMLSRVLYALKRYDEAEPPARRALAIRRSVYGENHPRVALIHNELGNLAFQRRRYDEAEANFTRALDIWRRAYSDKHSYIAIGLSNLSNVHKARGDPARAERLLRQALAIYAAVLPDSNVNVGIGRIRLGQVLLEQKRFRDAERETRRGYEIVSRQATPSVNWLMDARRTLASAHDALGNPDSAARYRRELADSAPSSPR